MDFKRILILAPHTDDAELGCGGTIARLIEEGIQVFVVAFSTAAESLPDDLPKNTLKKEFLEAMPILGVPQSNLIVYDHPVRKLSYFRQEVLDELVILRDRIKPDMVFLPSRNDLHQDHQVVFNEGMRAFNRNASLLGYELPWNHVTFSAQAFFILEDHHVNLKWKALKIYKSQFIKERRYFSFEYIQSLAKIRGVQVNANWAESFEVLKIEF